MRMERPELEEFQDKLEAKFGLIFDPSRVEQLREAFLSRRSELRLSGRDYLKRLDRNAGEWERLAAVLTVPESYFFRHIDHLQAFTDIALPERVAKRRGQKLQILCVGCANGEEPYTLSMICLENKGILGDCEVEIRGCDISREALQRAQQGIYTEWSLRATPPQYKARYFEHVGKKYRVNDEVRDAVSFEPCNVLDLYAPHLAGSVDIVFFRNVLIYFSPEAIRAAVSGLAHLLAPGGYLFLGPAETLRGISDDFLLCHTHETFYYQRKERISSLVRFDGSRRKHPIPSVTKTADESDEKLPREALPTASPDLLLGGIGTLWMDEIDRSTRKIRGLQAAPLETNHASARAKPPVRANAANRPTAAEETQKILYLLSAERYNDALQSIDRLPGEVQREPDVQLLRALSYLNRRDLEKAESASAEVLARDGMNATAHYILALCREHALDHAGAVNHDRTAIYLDEGFAMPHLHLALIARRRGDVHTARREFEMANLLLAREDASRIMMFGGGFSRESLRELCRRELKLLGAA
jgi:chemotaxis protein methyltransferase CheR